MCFVRTCGLHNSSVAQTYMYDRVLSLITYYILCILRQQQYQVVSLSVLLMIYNKHPAPVAKRGDASDHGAAPRQPHAVGGCPCRTIVHVGIYPRFYQINGIPHFTMNLIKQFLSLYKRVICLSKCESYRHPRHLQLTWFNISLNTDIIFLTQFNCDQPFCAVLLDYAASL